MKVYEVCFEHPIISDARPIYLIVNEDQIVAVSRLDEEFRKLDRESRKVILTEEGRIRNIGDWTIQELKEMALCIVATNHELSKCYAFQKLAEFMLRS